MPDFAYVARKATGEQVAGTISAASEREAAGILGERALFPVRIEQGKKAKVQVFGRSKKVRPAMLATTLTQLSDLLESGVPLMRALEVLSKQSSNPRMAEVMTEVRDQVADGATLDDAFRRHPLVFNELTVSMVRAGGEGGFLEEVLKRTASFIDHQEDLKGRVIGAATYPILLGGAGSLAVTILLVFFVPKFAEMFSRLEERGELPFLTTALLWVSGTLASYGLVLVAVVVGLVIWLRRYINTERGRVAFDGFKLKIPILGNLYLNLAVARFCRVLGTLLRNGVPILRSLEISSDATGNRVLGQTVRDAAENISSGNTLAMPLAECGLFPQSVVEMITVAEESNNLENVLINIAEAMDRRTERQLDLTVRLLEPAMLLVMAIVILLIVAALLLPVFQMSTTMG